MSAPQQLMEQHRGAFVRADVRTLIDCFTFQLQVVTVDVQISGQIDQLTITRVDVAHLMNAELDRRSPDRSPQSASVAVSGKGS